MNTDTYALSKEVEFIGQQTNLLNSHKKIEILIS